MKDNPKFPAGESTRRKIVDDFQLNVADCIMCGLCVEYCNFDAILMSDHFDASQGSRGSLVLGLDELLEMGREQEAKGRWQPPTVRKAQRRTAAQGGAPATVETTAATAVVESPGDAAAAVPPPADDRVAAGRARAAEMRAERARQKAQGTPSPEAEAHRRDPEKEQSP